MGKNLSQGTKRVRKNEMDTSSRRKYADIWITSFSESRVKYFLNGRWTDEAGEDVELSILCAWCKVVKGMSKY